MQNGHITYADRSLFSERFRIFDGNDYVYWQGRMRIRLQAISVELWEIVENGYTIPHPETPTPEDEANIRLNAQAKDIIYDSISRDIFIQFRHLDTAKQIWDALENVHEIQMARTDAHIDMLRAMFAHF